MTKSSAMERHLLLGASAVALLFAAMPASAQSTFDDGEIDEVVATGIRASIEESLALKRNSSSIIEAITAEDIGKLPDVSIADSLARLPGVTAQRVRGRAQQISIRGLGPDFSIALLNGREQVSASNNRGIEFDVFPSELIAQGAVYKTPDATLAATGIAGAVDLRTARPLDYSERKISASAKYAINGNGGLNPDFGSDGYRLFGSYIDQNDAGTLGWSIGVTNQSNPTQFFSRELKTNQFQTSQLDDGTFFAADNPRTGVVSRDFKRTSVAGSLQFEPTDRFEASVDAYYSDFEDTGIFRGVETPLASWSGNSVTATSGSGDFVDSATYAPSAAIVRTDTEGNTAEIYSIGGNISGLVTDRLRLTADLATSRIDKSDIDFESYSGTGEAVLFGANSADPSRRGTLTYVTPDSGEYSIDSSIDYSNPDNLLLTDPGGWGQVGFIKEPNIDDELNQLRLEAEYDLEGGFLGGLVAGVLLTEREKNFDSNENFIDPGTGFTDREAAIPNVLGTTDSGSIGLDVVAYDPSELLANGTYVLRAANSVQWTVEEEILTPYAKLLIDTEWGNVPVRGNLGMQYVDVEQTSSTGDGFITDSYADFLPSLNLSFEVMEDMLLRVGAARSVTRPRMDQLRATGTLSANTVTCGDTDSNGLVDTITGQFDPRSNQVCFGFGGGNPFLRPYDSKSFDVSLEKYFSDAGALSLAFFVKDVDDYIVFSSEIVDAGAALDGLIDPQLFDDPRARLVALGGPVNVEEAQIEGIEVALRLPFEDITPSLEGFGMNAAYTLAASDLEFMGQEIDIPGYSKHTFSGDVYYERNGIRARVNTRYRSDFLAEIQQFDGTLDGQQSLDEFIVDAQIGYEFQEGSLEGFSILLEGSNLTDEPFRTENDLDGPNNPGTATFISRREDYGRTFNITLAKTF